LRKEAATRAHTGHPVASRTARAVSMPSARARGWPASRGKRRMAPPLGLLPLASFFSFLPRPSGSRSGQVEPQEAPSRALHPGHHDGLPPEEGQPEGRGRLQGEAPGPEVAPEEGVAWLRRLPKTLPPLPVLGGRGFGFRLGPGPRGPQDGRPPCPGVRGPEVPPGQPHGPQHRLRGAPRETMDQHPAIFHADAQGRVPVVMGRAPGRPGVQAGRVHALEAGQEDLNLVLYLRWCGMMIPVH
jgi:hypothetical protein